MPIKRIHIVAITGWFLALVGLLAVRALLGVPATLLGSLGILLIGCFPAVVLLIFYRGAPPQSIGSVLYDAEHATVSEGDAQSRLPQADAAGRDGE